MIFPSSGSRKRAENCIRHHFGAGSIVVLCIFISTFIFHWLRLLETFSDAYYECGLICHNQPSFSPLHFTLEVDIPFHFINIKYSVRKLAVAWQMNVCALQKEETKTEKMNRYDSVYTHIVYYTTLAFDCNAFQLLLKCARSNGEKADSITINKSSNKQAIRFSSVFIRMNTNVSNLRMRECNKSESNLNCIFSIWCCRHNIYSYIAVANKELKAKKLSTLLFKLCFFSKIKSINRGPLQRKKKISWIVFATCFNLNSYFQLDFSVHPLILSYDYQQKV